MKQVPCFNPLCTKPVILTRRVANSSGVSAFCSRDCHAVWSLALREAARKLGANDPVQLQKLLLRSSEGVGIKTTLHVLDISRNQFESWMDKLPYEYSSPLVDIIEARQAIELRNV